MISLVNLLTTAIAVFLGIFLAYSVMGHTHLFRDNMRKEVMWVFFFILVGAILKLVIGLKIIPFALAFIVENVWYAVFVMIVFKHMKIFFKRDDELKV